MLSRVGFLWLARALCKLVAYDKAPNKCAITFTICFYRGHDCRHLGLLQIAYLIGNFSWQPSITNFFFKTATPAILSFRKSNVEQGIRFH